MSQRKRTIRRGLTIIELLFAVMIMAMVAAALQAMIGSVQLANDYSQGYGTATQHARVAISRIETAVHQAYGKSIYPGVWVTQDTDGQWTYPNTLVVWQPSGTPANAAGPPLVQELVIFCPDPNAPNDLVQLTVPRNTTTVPTTNSASFTTLINSLKTSSTASKVVLTNLLQVAAVSSTVGGAASRSGVRFVATLTPSAASWSSYLSGGTAWGNLPWAQGMCSAAEGRRMVWLRSEIQLVPGVEWTGENSAAATPVPFFGSACFSYPMP
jgi:prepilin-type N-terminal cleavage/methylation domain-containing protein